MKSHSTFHLRHAVALVMVLGLATPSGVLSADLGGLEIMERVAARDAGDNVTRDLTIELTDKGGTTRVQKTTGYRKEYDQETRSIIFYTDPTNIRGTGFLIYDYSDASKEDDQWLYLPALRKIRRISASDRGDYFMGTDFTYEEIKKGHKVEIADYNFKALGSEITDGKELLVVEGIPVNERTSRELGYSRGVWQIDPATWIPMNSQFWDINGNPSKTVAVEHVEEVDGIWTPMRIRAKNLKTGHQTLLTVTKIDYQEPVNDRLLEQSRLRRGL